MKVLSKVTLIGNLGKALEIQLLETKAKVAKFSLATTESYKDELGQLHSKTEWHSIALWIRLADLAEKYLVQGSLVYIEGKLSTRTYNNKEGIKKQVTEIIAQGNYFTE
jgi:single-strand DNA-binding protein